MPTTQAIDVQDIDHLGIVAGIVDEIGLVEIVDELFKERKQKNGRQNITSNCSLIKLCPIKLNSIINI